MTEPNQTESQERVFQKRNPAVIASVSEITKAKFIKEDGFTPNYVETAFMEKISRVNIIGNVVSKDTLQPQNASTMIDDGTGTVIMRTFDNPEIFNNAQLGDLVTVIGKPREFNNEIYVAVEIIKKLDSLKWAELRHLELKRKYKKLGLTKPIKTEQKSTDNKTELKSEEPVTDQEEVVDSENNKKGIIDLIRKMDKGKGAELSELIKKHNIDEKKIQSEIDHLLKRGDIFELRPGVLKVLE